jgi:hypothetical protein
MKLKASTLQAGAAVAAAAAVAGCGSSGSPSAHSSASSPDSIQRLAAATPGVNVLELTTGTDQHKISATIQAFYRTTWQDQGPAACSLFSPAGASGFLESARVAFPDSVSSATTCPQAMAFYNADLADSVDTLQQAGVKVSGNILENVGVDHIKVNGTTATAQAPEGVEEFIRPKLFVLVRSNGRWYIQASRKIGQTLPQLLAAAKKKGELIPKSARTAGKTVR